MDGNQLFWATGIDNTKLNANVDQAINAFRRLSTSVNKELDTIEARWGKMLSATKVKFDNPVDPAMIASIKSQIQQLDEVIKNQIQALASYASSYDKAIEKINKAAQAVGKSIPKNSPLQPTVDNIQKSVRDTDRELSYMEKIYKRAIGYLVAYGSINWAQSLITQMITVKGQFDQLRVAINAFIGDAEQGQIVFEQLTTLAVKSPFQLLDITDSAKQLLAYGVAAKDVTESVRMLSDVSAGSGQSIKDIAYLYGTSLTQGRLYARDLFQFANRGIPIYGELAKVMGIGTEELAKQVKLGKVGFNELKAAIEGMTQAGGQYYGLSDQLAETTYGKISNLKDRWQLALNEMGTQNDGIVSTAVAGLTGLINNWEEVSKALSVMITTYGAYRVALMIASVETSGYGLKTLALRGYLITTASAQKLLNSAVLSNPYALAAMAIITVASALYIYKDNMDAVKNANESFKNAQDEANAALQEWERSVNDAMNTMKNSNATDLEKQKALQLLKKELPGYIDWNNKQAVSELNVAKATKYANEQSERKAKLMLYQQADTQRQIMAASQETIKTLEQAMKTPQTQWEFAATQTMLNKQRLIYNQAAEEYKLYTTRIKEYDELQKAAEIAANEEIVKNKEYFTEKMQEAQNKLDAMPVSEKGSKQWKALEAEIRAASKALEAYNMKQGGKSVVDKSDQQNADRQRDLDEKAKAAEIKAKESALAIEHAGIDGMQEGFAKQQAQIDINFRKSELESEKRTNEAIKNEIKRQETLWQIANPDFKKTGKVFATPTVTRANLPKDVQQELDNYDKVASLNKLNSEKELYKRLIDANQNYATQRLEIERKYNDQIAALEKLRTEQNASTTDAAIEQAKKLKSSEIASLDFEIFKDSDAWQKTFEDLGRMSTRTLNGLIESLEKTKKAASKDLPIKDFKELSTAIEKLRKEAVERNPFAGLVESMRSLKQANTDVKKATEDYNIASENGTAYILEYDSATGELISKVIDLEEAEKRLTKAQDNRNSSLVNATESIQSIASKGKDIIGAAQDVSDILTNLGVKVPETVEKYIAGTSKVIEGLSEVDVTKPFTVITGGIKAISGMVEQVTAFFGSPNIIPQEVFDRYEALMNTIDDVLDRQQELLDGLSGAEAQAQYNKSIKLLRDQERAARDLGIAYLNSGASWKDHSIGYELRKDLEQYRRELQAVGIDFESLGGRMEGLFKLTASQLESIQGTKFWAALDDKTRGFLEQIIEGQEKSKELADLLNESLTGVSFDSVRDGFDSLLTDAETTAEDVAQSFEKYMNDAFLNIVKSKYLTDALSGWYDQFASATADEVLTDSEVESLRKQYSDIFDEAKRRIDLLGEAIGKGPEDTDSSPTATAIKSITQEQADLLSAQAIAIRINITGIKEDVSKILLNLSGNSAILANQANLLEIAFQDVREIAENTRTLYDIKRSLNDMITNGIKVK